MKNLLGRWGWSRKREKKKRDSYGEKAFSFEWGGSPMRKGKMPSNRHTSSERGHFFPRKKSQANTRKKTNLSLLAVGAAGTLLMHGEGGGG